MIGKLARMSGTIVGVAAVTWLALALILYLALYRTIGEIYQNVGRDVLQVSCGQVVPNELIYTLAPGVCQFANAEFDTRVLVDADGFRNAREHLGSGPIKVAVLGDSHAMGWGVEQGDKLSSLLARDARLTVRDLAMSSYGTARELLAMRRYAGAADVIIVQYCDNDRAENTEFLRDPAAFIANAPVRARQYEAETLAVQQAAERSRTLRTVLRSGLAGIAATWRLLWLPPRAGRETPQPVIEQEAKLFAGVLAHFKAELTDKTIIVFDSFPRSPRVGFAKAFDAALQAVGLNHVVVLDFAGTLAPSDYFHIDDHMRARGHAKVAARVQNVLAQSGKLPVGP